MHVTKVRTVAVPVTDHERALEFYVGTLGFETRMDFSLGEDDRWVEVAPAGAVTTIALVSARNGAQAGVDTGIRLTTDDAVADHASLVARGADADPEVMREVWAPPMFALRDPDGNRLVIVEGD